MWQVTGRLLTRRQTLLFPIQRRRVIFPRRLFIASIGSVTPKTTRTPVLRPYTPPGGSEYLEEKVQVSFYSGSLELSWTLVRVGS